MRDKICYIYDWSSGLQQTVDREDVPPPLEV